jgi:hypothetical protein
LSSNQEIKLRNLGLADYSDVNAVYKSVIEEYRTFLSNRGMQEKLSDTIEFENFISFVNTQSSFVALAENHIVGFILAREMEWINGQRKTPWVEFIAIKSELSKVFNRIEIIRREKSYAPSRKRRSKGRETQTYFRSSTTIT